VAYDGSVSSRISAARFNPVLSDFAKNDGARRRKPHKVIPSHLLEKLDRIGNYLLAKNAVWNPSQFNYSCYGGAASGLHSQISRVLDPTTHQEIVPDRCASQKLGIFASFTIVLGILII